MSVGAWLRNHPYLLEPAYEVTHWLSFKLNPLFKRLGHDKIGQLIVPAEEATKKIVFDCRMCGQCILHSTGMTCPMSCPKTLRNGPCGGVRADGYCEVKPEMRCVWVEAYERAEKMKLYGEEMMLVQPPVNWSLKGQSAWVTLLTGEATKRPAGWDDLPAHNTKAEFHIPEAHQPFVKAAGMTALGSLIISGLVWGLSRLNRSS